MAEQESGKARKPVVTKSLLLVLGAVLLVTVTLLLVRQIPGLQKVLIQVEKSGLKVEVGADGKLDVADFVARVSASEADKAALLRLLKDEWRVYRLDDPELVDALAGLCPEVAVNDVTAYQAGIRGCDSQRVMKQLRDLAVTRKAPFQMRAVPVRIGTPQNVQILKGLAYTCFDGELENKRIMLVDTATSRKVEIIARGGYECLPGAQFPDLHIAAGDASDLFERPTLKVENALALY